MSAPLKWSLILKHGDDNEDCNLGLPNYLLFDSFLIKSFNNDILQVILTPILSPRH